MKNKNKIKAILNNKMNIMKTNITNRDKTNREYNEKKIKYYTKFSYKI